MNLATAQNYANRIIDWLRPHIETREHLIGYGSIHVAGSIRRHRPECGDVDIVCLPRITEQKDMLGEVIEHTNHLWNHIVTERAAGRLTIESGGEKPGRMMIAQLRKCQLDLWFATRETFGTRLMCRTGSKEHNIWMASRAKRRGWKWNPYEGLFTGGIWTTGPSGVEAYAGGTLHPARTEAEIYQALDLPFIEPQNRELPWLVKEFGE